MNHHRNRRSKFRSNGRGRRNGMNHHRHGMRSLDPGQSRQNNNFSFRGYQNAEKLIEKYSKLAKEALSTGDKILSENYFQHADHFSRIVAIKNSEKLANQTVNTSNTPNIPSASDSNIEKNNNVTEETSKELDKLTD